MNMTTIDDTVGGYMSGGHGHEEEHGGGHDAGHGHEGHAHGGDDVARKLYDTFVAGVKKERHAILKDHNTHRAAAHKTFADTYKHSDLYDESGKLTATTENAYDHIVDAMTKTVQVYREALGMDKAELKGSYERNKTFVEQVIKQRYRDEEDLDEAIENGDLADLVDQLLTYSREELVTNAKKKVFDDVFKGKREHYKGVLEHHAKKKGKEWSAGTLANYSGPRKFEEYMVQQYK